MLDVNMDAILVDAGRIQKAWLEARRGVWRGKMNFSIEMACFGEF